MIETALRLLGKETEMISFGGPIGLLIAVSPQMWRRFVAMREARATAKVKNSLKWTRDGDDRSSGRLFSSVRG